MSESVYKRIDRAVYQVEKAIVVVSLVLMAVVVFLDVVHRSFSGEESKFAGVIAKMAGWFGAEIVPETPAYESLASASPWILTATFIGLTYFGIRSTKRETPIPVPHAIGGAVVGVAVAYGAVLLLLRVMPNGLIWSQPLALVLTLWVGFIGASMCTYENRHLRVEAVQRFLPEKLRPAIGFASGLLTALVCAGMLWVSMRYVKFHYEDFVATGGKGGLFNGMDLPKYQGFAALPIAFGLMTVRFFVKALDALRGNFAEPIDPVAAAGGVPAEEFDPNVPLPSEVPTEAFPLRGDADAPKVRDGARPQSAVATDSHKVIPSALRRDDPEDTQDVDGPPVDPNETVDVDLPPSIDPKEDSQ